MQFVKKEGTSTTAYMGKRTITTIAQNPKQLQDAALYLG
jgi:hypothetical protein